MLFIERQGGGYDILIARYYPASEADVRGFDEINYGMLAEGWSGTVDVYGYDEGHAKRFMIVDGQVVNAARMRPVRSESEMASASTVLCTGQWVDFPYYPIPGGVGSSQSQYVTVCDDYFHSNNEGLHTIWNPTPGQTGYSGGPGSTWGSDPAMPDPTCPEYYGSQCYHQPGAVYKPTSPEENLQRYIQSIKDPEAKRKAQLDYLKTHGGRDFAEMVEELLKTPGLTTGDVSEINKLVEQIYQQQKGKFIMAIFSPANLSQILFLASADISSTVRNRVFSLTSKLATKTGSDLLIPLGLGSTGRTIAKNVTEKFAMKEVMSNPSALGKAIPNLKPLSDPRWKGWIKMSNKNAHGVEIHFNAQFKNGKIINVDDFKFIGQ